jgi:hypothetical protein
MENHHFKWVNQLFLWPFPIATWIHGSLDATGDPGWPVTHGLGRDPATPHVQCSNRTPPLAAGHRHCEPDRVAVGFGTEMRGNATNIMICVCSLYIYIYMFVYLCIYPWCLYLVSESVSYLCMFICICLCSYLFIYLVIGWSMYWFMYLLIYI